MANGLCGNKKCLVNLIEDNCKPSIFKVGVGFCRDCINKRKRENRRDRPTDYRAADLKRRIKHAGQISAAQSSWRERNRDYERQRNLEYSHTVEGHHTRIREDLRKEKIPHTDLLWTLNFYKELVKDNQCHYCLGFLSKSGHSLDRIRNDIGHTCYNVVPCCKRCNSIKGKYWEYEHMMLLAPKLRKIRKEENQNASSANPSDGYGLGPAED